MGLSVFLSVLYLKSETAISSCKKSWSRLGWAEALGFSSFLYFFFFFLLCGMKAWLLEQLCNHKGKAQGCWLGGVLAWLHHCKLILWEFPSQPDTHTLPIFPAPEPATSKTSIVYFIRNWCLQWNRCPQLSSGGENTHFLLKVSVAREAGAVLMYLLLWFYFEVHTC